MAVESIIKTEKKGDKWYLLSLFFTLFLLTYTLVCFLPMEGLFARLSTWTLPVFIYLWLQNEDPWTYLKLNTTKGLFFAIGFSLIVYGLGSLLFGVSHLNLSIPSDVWWNVIILVGLSEEVVFRGFLLQKIENLTSSFWIGNVIQTLLFTLTHIPYWLSQGQSITPRLLGFVLIAGFILGMIFRQTKSLWACMLIHSVNNFCSIAIIYS